MKLSQRLSAERDYVVKSLGELVICSLCGADLNTYSVRCVADLSDQCDGFNRIEQAKREFNAKWDAEHAGR